MAQFLAQLWEVLTRRVDSFLLGIALSIAGVGLITLFSASDQSVARITSLAASLGFALMLIWAGFVESFLSQYHEPIIPYSAKIAFGAVELVLLILFFARSGANTKQS